MMPKQVKIMCTYFVKAPRHDRLNYLVDFFIYFFLLFVFKCFLRIELFVLWNSLNLFINLVPFHFGIQLSSSILSAVSHSKLFLLLLRSSSFFSGYIPLRISPDFSFFSHHYFTVILISNLPLAMSLSIKKKVTHVQRRKGTLDIT